MRGRSGPFNRSYIVALLFRLGTTETHVGPYKYASITSSLCGEDAHGRLETLENRPKNTQDSGNFGTSYGNGII
jgi:hypothetical protein